MITTKKSIGERVLNEGLDLLSRIERSGVYNFEKSKIGTKVKALTEEKKQQLKDFIFGKTNDNPLSEKKQKENKKAETIWLVDLLKEKKLVRSTAKLEREMRESGWVRCKTTDFPAKVYFVKVK